MVDAAVLARELQELIAALDRRVPRVERAGEASIAREGAALKAKAMKRLAELSAEKAGRLSGKPAASSDRARRA